MLQEYIIDGKTYDLSHLETVRQNSVFKLRRGSKTAPVEVTFSCHCWSRRPIEGEDIPSTHFVYDGSQESPRHRIFCPARHELSLELPRIINKMLTERERVHFTKKHNVVFLELLAPIVAGRPAITYYMFIKLRKVTPEGQQKYIKAVIESAYADNVMYDTPSYGKPIAFEELLGDCWEGRFPK